MDVLFIRFYLALQDDVSDTIIQTNLKAAKFRWNILQNFPPFYWLKMIVLAKKSRIFSHQRKFGGRGTSIKRYGFIAEKYFHIESSLTATYELCSSLMQYFKHRFSCQTKSLTNLFCSFQEVTSSTMLKLEITLGPSLSRSPNSGSHGILPRYLQLY